MYQVNKNISRLDKCVINSFKRIENGILINFSIAELTDFIEEGYSNRISTEKSVLRVTNIISESFHFNKSKKITILENLENDYFISGFNRNIDNDNFIELEIITWKKDQPYDENDDTNFIVWKLKAEFYELQWDRFVHW